MALAERATLVTELRLDDKLSGGLRKAQGSLRGLDGAAKRAGQGLKTLGGLMATAGKLAAVGAAGVVVGAVKMAADFEAALNTINTVAMATPEALDKIGDSMRKLARDTGTELGDLTAGYYDLVSAGIKTADAQNVLTQANTLGIGALSSTAEAVDLLTTAINTYGGDATKAAAYTDIFAKAVERGKVTASEIASSFANVGPLAASLGVDVAELGAGYARLTAGGTKAGEAATQMASALTALLKKTPGLEALEKATKKNYAAIAGSDGLNVALEQMRTDAKKAGIEIIDLVGRKEALLYILQTTGPNLKAYNADLAAMADAEGTAARQMGERQKGLVPQLKMLKAGLKDAAITIGSALLPKLTPLVKKLNDWLNLDTTQAGIADFATNLASGFEAVAKWAGTVPWGEIASGLQAAAGFAGNLISVFANMPPQAQATILALVGLNKLTGGAVAGIVGDLGKGIIKGVLGMNAGVVNINAGVVNGGGGLPGPGGPTKTTGTDLLGNLVKGAYVLTVAGILAEAIAADPKFKEPRYKTPIWNADVVKDGTAPVVDAIDRLAGLPGPFAHTGEATAKKSGGALFGLSLSSAGVLGVMNRAISTGMKPTQTGIIATLKRNAVVQATIDRGRAVAAAREAANAVAQGISNTNRIVGAILGINIPSPYTGIPGRQGENDVNPAPIRPGGSKLNLRDPRAGSSSVTLNVNATATARDITTATGKRTAYNGTTRAIGRSG